MIYLYEYVETRKGARQLEEVKSEYPEFDVEVYENDFEFLSLVENGHSLLEAYKICSGIEDNFETDCDSCDDDMRFAERMTKMVDVINAVELSKLMAQNANLVQSDDTHDDVIATNVNVSKYAPKIKKILKAVGFIALLVAGAAAVMTPILWIPVFLIAIWWVDRIEKKYRR